MHVSSIRSAQELVDILLSYKPQVLYGTRASLEFMALELKQRGVKPDGLKLLLGAGDVIHKNTRKFLTRQFGVELTECYGSAETGVMAYETPRRDGLHICHDLTYFEFLDDEAIPVLPGEAGRVVVTDLQEN